jgi:hypothetical protein
MAQKSAHAMLDKMQDARDNGKTKCDEQYEGHLNWLRRSVRENKKRLFPSATDTDEQGTAKRAALKVCGVPEQNDNFSAEVEPVVDNESVPPI